jgi:hypothetical protein
MSIKVRPVFGSLAAGGFDADDAQGTIEKM